MFMITNVCSNASVALLGEEKGEVLLLVLLKYLDISSPYRTNLFYGKVSRTKLNTENPERGPQNRVSGWSPEPKIREKERAHSTATVPLSEILLKPRNGNA